ncbi:MAG TPA: 2-phospho-L-lactate transferase [Actinomycetota bacterium]|nr:2-phospho-L-lactate transferase [Actinomycetota bacterium]
MRVTALAGGVGAAKFLRGLVPQLLADPDSEVTVIGNTGDDAVFHGLHVSPDLDIVTYTLAGIVDTAKGWGVAGDTRHALDHMGRLGVDTWFWLGDKDFGTHIARTMWLAEGLALSVIADRIRLALGVGARILPMSDDPVRTRLLTAAGTELEFQDYFVRRGHADEIAAVSFDGAAGARPAPGVLEAIEAADRVIICPSNPVVSIGPILAVPRIRDALRAVAGRVVAISPIVQGSALRGPADRLLPVVGAEASASGVAGLYADVCRTFVLDRRDPGEVARVEALGLRPVMLETVMETPEVAATLAKEILALEVGTGDGR